MPRSAKVAVVFAGLWVLSPIDLIPEFLPVTDPLDDVVVAALCLRYAARRSPHSTLVAAWDPNVLDRFFAPAGGAAAEPADRRESILSPLPSSPTTRDAVPRSSQPWTAVRSRPCRLDRGDR